MGSEREQIQAVARAMVARQFNEWDELCTGDQAYFEQLADAAIEAMQEHIIAAEARGMEKAALWHDERSKGPDVFETELHEISAAAIRHIAANPSASPMEALDAAQAARTALNGGQHE